MPIKKRGRKISSLASTFALLGKGTACSIEVLIFHCTGNFEISAELSMACGPACMQLYVGGFRELLYIKVRLTTIITY